MLSNGIKRSSLIAYASPTFCLMFMVGPGQSVIQGVYAQHFGLLLADLASIIFICRIFDAITDPLIGFISDRTRNRLPGGRKFMVVIGVILSLVSVYFLFIPVNTPVTREYFFIWYLLCYLGWTLIEIPHLSWGSELSHNYEDRATVFTYRTFFFYLGYSAFLALPFLPIFDEGGYTPQTLEVAFWIVAVLFPVTVFFATRYCPQGAAVAENKKSNVLHAFKALLWNRPLRLFTLIFVVIGLGLGMQTGIAFLFITSFLGLEEEAPIIFVTTLPFVLIGLWVWLKLSKTIGKHYGMVIGTSLTSVTFFMLALMKPGEGIFWTFILLNTTIIFFQGSWVSIGPSMLGDIVDYDQSVTGEDNSATYYAFYTFIRKAFEGIGGGLGLFIAAKYGFDPANLVINEDVVFSMQLVMAYLPGGLLLLAAFFSFKSPITAERHKQILAEIEQKKSTDGSEITS